MPDSTVSTTYNAAYPELRRARGYRLYTRDGGRLLDLYQDDGRAFLGHDPAGLSLAMKAEIERGLHAGGQSRHMRNIQRELNALWPLLAGDSERPHWLVLRSPDRLHKVLGQDAGCRLVRPALHESGQTTDGALELRLPLPGAHAPVVIGLYQDAGNAAAEHDACSPVQLAGLHRVLSLLRKDPRVAAQHLSLVKLDQAWRSLRTPLFERRGVYLYARVVGPLYAEFHRRMLERGFFLHPLAGGLNTIPGICSPGEFAAFDRACKELKEFADVT